MDYDVTQTSTQTRDIHQALAWSLKGWGFLGFEHFHYSDASPIALRARASYLI